MEWEVLWSSTRRAKGARTAREDAMSGSGFSRIPVQGFISLLEDLDKGHWGRIEGGPHLAEGAAPPPSMMTAAREVEWKYRLRFAIEEAIRVEKQTRADL